MKLFFTVSLVTLSASLAAVAQLRPRDRFPITTDQVAAKLIASFAQKGVVLDAKQITLPAEVTATEESPALEIRSVEKLGSLQANTAETTSSAVKFACAKATVCLPFYAVVTLSGAGFASTSVKGSGGNFAATGGAPVIKFGAHLTLLVDSGSAHIQMAVVSLQNGALNQQIRVRSVADRKQILTAQVLSATTVKGTL